MSINKLSNDLVEATKKVLTKEVLKRYERQRKGDNLSMMAAMQAFKWGFGSRHPAVTLFRNAGLSAVAAVPKAKRWFIQQAVG